MLATLPVVARTMRRGRRRCRRPCSLPSTMASFNDDEDGRLNAAGLYGSSVLLSAIAVV